MKETAVESEVGLDEHQEIPLYMRLRSINFWIWICAAKRILICGVILRSGVARIGGR